ncbi:hypothetical protein KEM55_008773, partial [Ascosphaera atra]
QKKMSSSPNISPFTRFNASRGSSRSSFSSIPSPPRRPASAPGVLRPATRRARSSSTPFHPPPLTPHRTVRYTSYPFPRTDLLRTDIPPEPIETPALFEVIQLIFRDAEGNVVVQMPVEHQEFDARLDAARETLTVEESVILLSMSAEPKKQRSTDVESLVTAFEFTPGDIELRALHAFEDGALYAVFGIAQGKGKEEEKGLLGKAKATMQDGFYAGLMLSSPLRDMLMPASEVTSEGRGEVGSGETQGTKYKFDSMHLLVPRHLLNTRWTAMSLLKTFHRIDTLEFQNLRESYGVYSRIWGWNGQKERGDLGGLITHAMVSVKQDYLRRFHDAIKRFGGDEKAMKEEWRQQVSKFVKPECIREREAGNLQSGGALAEIEASNIHVDLDV